MLKWNLHDMGPSIFPVQKKKKKDIVCGKQKAIFFTIFSWVADHRVRLRPLPYLIDSLNFDLEGREVVYVLDNEQRFSRFILVPVGPAAQHLPPHHLISEFRSTEVTLVHFLQWMKEHKMRRWLFLFPPPLCANLDNIRTSQAMTSISGSVDSLLTSSGLRSGAVIGNKFNIVLLAGN